MTTEFVTPLRGANFRPQQAKDKVLALESGDLVDLIPEPDNPYDPNAIRVEYEEEHLGYVAKEVAVDLIEPFNSAAAYSAVVDYFTGPLTPVIQIELDADDETVDDDEVEA